MPLIDIIDQSLVVADPAELAVLVADPAWSARHWPELALTVREHRGVEGVRWQVGGALAGRAEVWLQPWQDGTVLNYFLQADPAAHRIGRADPNRLGQRLRREYQLRWRRVANGLKDQLEAGRAVGAARLPTPPEAGPWLRTTPGPR